MKYLYKYPQREFPYRDLLETNRGRTREELEYELVDTGIFDDNGYLLPSRPGRCWTWP